MTPAQEERGREGAGGGPFKRSKEEEEGGVGPPLQSVKPQQEVSKEALGLKSPVIRLQAPPHLRIRGGGMEREEGGGGEVGEKGGTVEAEERDNCS